MLLFQINKKAGVSNVDQLADCISTALLYTPAKGGISMVQNETLKANRMYKDTVFRMLFSDRKNLLSLYNAISGSHYDDPDKLEIVTLENAIYMGMKNDLAFIVDTDSYVNNGNCHAKKKVQPIAINSVLRLP